MLKIYNLIAFNLENRNLSIFIAPYVNPSFKNDGLTYFYFHNDTLTTSINNYR